MQTTRTQCCNMHLQVALLLFGCATWVHESTGKMNLRCRRCRSRSRRWQEVKWSVVYSELLLAELCISDSRTLIFSFMPLHRCPRCLPRLALSVFIRIQSKPHQRRHWPRDTHGFLPVPRNINTPPEQPNAGNAQSFFPNTRCHWCIKVLRWKLCRATLSSSAIFLH